MAKKLLFHAILLLLPIYSTLAFSDESSYKIQGTVYDAILIPVENVQVKYLQNNDKVICSNPIVQTDAFGKFSIDCTMKGIQEEYIYNELELSAPNFKSQKIWHHPDKATVFYLYTDILAMVSGFVNDTDTKEPVIQATVKLYTSSNLKKSIVEGVTNGAGVIRLFFDPSNILLKDPGTGKNFDLLLSIEHDVYAPRIDVVYWAKDSSPLSKYSYLVDNQNLVKLVSLNSIINNYKICLRHTDKSFEDLIESPFEKLDYPCSQSFEKKCFTLPDGKKFCKPFWSITYNQLQKVLATSLGKKWPYPLMSNGAAITRMYQALKVLADSNLPYKDDLEYHSFIIMDSGLDEFAAGYMNPLNGDIFFHKDAAVVTVFHEWGHYLDYRFFYGNPDYDPNVYSSTMAEDIDPQLQKLRNKLFIEWSSFCEYGKPCSDYSGHVSPYASVGHGSDFAESVGFYYPERETYLEKIGLSQEEVNNLPNLVAMSEKSETLLEAKQSFCEEYFIESICKPNSEVDFLLLLKYLFVSEHVFFGLEVPYIFYY